MSEMLQGLLVGILLVSGIGLGLLIYLTGTLRKFIKGLNADALLSEYDRITGEQNKPLAAAQPEAGLARKFESAVLENEQLRKEINAKAQEIYALKGLVAGKDGRIAQLEVELAASRTQLENQK